MPKFEYKVVPAPARGKRAKGVKGPAGRFANALESVMNDLGALGWEYLRTDTLPAEERSGLTSRVTVFQNMLVFRREIQVPQQMPDYNAADEIRLLEKAETSLSAPTSATASKRAKAAEPPIKLGDEYRLDDTADHDFDDSRKSAVQKALTGPTDPFEMPAWDDAFDEDELHNFISDSAPINSALRTRAAQVTKSDIAAE